MEIDIKLYPDDVVRDFRNKQDHEVTLFDFRWYDDTIVRLATWITFYPENGKPIVLKERYPRK